jgi:hypothetical protein
MRSAQYALATALTLALAGTATAQTTAPPPSTATTQATTYGETVSHWLASGFVGGGFSASGDFPNIDTNGGSSVAYGGQVGYLWHGVVGPEFLFEWAPNFNAISSTFISGDTHVHSYMANAIGAIPLGADGQFVPFISGGFGSIRANADVLTTTGNTFSSSRGGGGNNIGGGVMAFANRIGVRGDLRHYHASTDQNFTGTVRDQVLAGTLREQLIEGVLSGLSYWRATGGVSFRW